MSVTGGAGVGKLRPHDRPSIKGILAAADAVCDAAEDLKQEIRKFETETPSRGDLCWISTFPQRTALNEAISEYNRTVGSLRG